METFIVTSNIVLPTFLLIALGYFLQRIGILEDCGCAKMNKLAFEVFIPAMIFYNIYGADLSTITDVKILCFVATSIIVLFIFLMIVIPLVENDGKKRGVIVQAIFRSSFVVLGMGLVSAMYPNANLGTTAVLSAITAPLFNAFGVIALELYVGNKIDVKKIVINIVTNPLIIASFLAIIFLLLDFKIPKAIDKLVYDLSKVATPFALIILGGTFRFNEIKSCGKQLISICVSKLVLVPLIFVLISIGLGYRGVELLSLLIVFGSPTAVSSHIMSVNAGADDKLAGQAVVFTTCFSSITLFVFIYTLLSMGLL